ncbi:MAG: substrate-binding domain-containing protein [Planctomycetota bacterium]
MNYRDQGSYWTIPTDAFPRMEQSCVILDWVKDRDAAERLRNFVVGPEGREILKNHGFDLPGE